MRDTRMAVVISEEQGEIERFRKWGLDVRPHRKLIKQGFETEDGKRIDVETAFKDEDHTFRIAIVCAMWLTGFDVPSLSTLYLDKPLKAHTLMQAIARANRVSEGKNNGLIVDYCGILKNLRKALATFAGHQGPGNVDDLDVPPGLDPVKPEEELLGELEEAIEIVRAYLEASSFRLEDVVELTGFARNKAIIDAKEAVNQNDETRKRFEIIFREVFKKFKACLTIKGVNEFRHQYDAINVIYKGLQEDVEQADISSVIRELHRVIDESIETTDPDADGEDRTYDMSKIDFDRLRREFEKSPAKNTIVHNLKDMIEQRLQKMLAENPARTNFQRHYEEIVEEYNREKDRATIERTFQQLLSFTDTLSEEEQRAIKEGLDEESLALFDLLLKPDLGKKDIARIKKVAVGLYERLRAELDKIRHFEAKQSTRDEIKVTIKNFLWDENTGLPESFDENEIDEKADRIFAHLLVSARSGRSPELRG